MQIFVKKTDIRAGKRIQANRRKRGHAKCPGSAPKKDKKRKQALSFSTDFEKIRPCGPDANVVPRLTCFLVFTITPTRADVKRETADFREKSGSQRRGGRSSARKR